MIHFLATRFGLHTIDEYLAGAGAPDRDILKPVPYGHPLLRSAGEPPPGVYLFTDIERLSPAEEAQAGELWERLQEDPARWVTLNQPGRTLRRLELLRKLQAEGINRHRAWPLWQPPPPDVRFPVFLRVANDHDGARSGLLEGPEALQRRIEELRSQGKDLEGWIACEYAGSQRPDGAYAKYAAFLIGDEVIPRGVLFNSHWQVKEAGLFEEGLLAEERDHVARNPHADLLRRVFALAGVDYGRVDYGVDAEGRISVWEINTNPQIFSLALTRSSHRRELNRKWVETFGRKMRALNDRVPHRPGTVGILQRAYWAVMRWSATRPSAGRLERSFRSAPYRILRRLSTRGPFPAGNPGKGGRPGLCYASRDGGDELPVIDITHPSFGYPPPKGRERSIVERVLSRAVIEPMGKFWPGSPLVREVRDARGSFLSGMGTYLMKLGPEHQKPGWGGWFDRRIAASELARTLRLRLWDMAHLQAEGVAPALAENPGVPLHFINIGGGPAIDNLNALILLSRDPRRLLSDRKVLIHVLELEREGPAFGSRALDALRSAGGPLRGLEIALEVIDYDWEDPEPLRRLLGSLGPAALVVVSSEGALFSYASDGVVAAHLDLFRRTGPGLLVGSVARSQAPSGGEKNAQGPALQHRDWSHLEKLAVQSGWVPQLVRSTEFSHHFRMTGGLK
ncbi:MAG TPA: hypothetical protein VHE12_00560 [bacterium]|nr:hypothetical protein [bacterium]